MLVGESPGLGGDLGKALWGNHDLSGLKVHIDRSHSADYTSVGRSQLDRYSPIEPLAHYQIWFASAQQIADFVGYEPSHDSLSGLG